MQNIMRLLLLVIAAFLVTIIHLFGPNEGILSLPRTNEIAKKTVIAPFAFDIIRNPDDVQREQSEQRRKVLSVFDYDEGASERVYQRLNALEDKIRPGHRQPDTSNLFGISPQTLAVMRQNPRLLEEVRFSMDRLLDSGISSVLVTSDLAKVKEYKEKFRLATVPYLFYDKDYVSFRRRDMETAFPVSALLPREALVEREINRLQKAISGPEKLGAISEILLFFSSPNVFYNPEETSLRREAEAAKVVTTRGRIVQGAQIVARGERITPEISDALYSLQIVQSRAAQSKKSAGRVSALFFLAVLLFICIELLLRAFFRSTLVGREFTSYLLLLVSCLALIRGFEVLIPQLNPQWDFPYLRPYFAGPAMAALIWGTPAGVAMGVFIALAGLLFSGLSDMMLPFIILGGAYGAWIYSRIRRIQDFAVSGILLAAGVGLLCLPFHIFTSESGFLRQTAEAAGGGLLSACFSMFVRPFELIAGRRSRTGLQTYSNLDHPLLTRLSVEAAGTFQHSLNVSNMCAAAAENIGEDPNMARIAGLYHDIGKVLKPAFYWENRTGEHGPKESEVARSALRNIVVSHVSDGAKLSAEYNLPSAVVDSILEHHGSNPVLDGSAPEGEEIKEAALRYPGPKPSSKISTLVMLADALEMAIRNRGILAAADRLSAGNGILRQMILSGQLEHSPLTLDELTRVMESMVLVLRGFQPGFPQAGKQE